MKKSNKLRFVMGVSTACAVVLVGFTYQANLYKVVLDDKQVGTTGRMIDGKPYVAAEDIAKALGMTISVDKATSTIRFSYAGLGVNLVKNGGFEEGEGIDDTDDDLVTIPGWTRENGKGQVATYELGEFQIEQGNRPKNGGKNYFAGADGKGVHTTVQSLKLPESLRADLDTGKIKFTLRADVGGFEDHPDPLNFSLEWLDESGKSLGVSRLPAVTPAHRGNLTKFIERSITGNIPAKASSARIKLVVDLVEGAWNDCYADNISLVLSK